MRASYVILTIGFLLMTVVGTEPLLAPATRDTREFRTVELVAFDPSSAVIVSAAQDDVRLDLVDEWGRTRWRRFVHGDVQSLSSVKVADDFIAVMYRQDQQPRIVAFDAKGRRLWDVRVFEPAAKYASEVDAEVVGSTLLVWTRDERAMLAVDRFTGKELWAQDGPAELISRRFKTTTAVIFDNYSIGYSVDARTGIVQSSEHAGLGCVVNNDYMTLRGHTLTTFEAGDLSRAHASYVRGDWGEQGSARLRACGTYENKLVVVLGVWDGNATERDEIAIIDQGDVVRSLHLPIYSIFNDETEFAGELPRFVPLLTRIDEKSAWLVIDLQSARVSWQEPQHDDIGMSHAFKSGHRWVVASSYPDDAVTLVDGDTGDAYASVTLRGRADSIEHAAASHLRSNKLWVVSSDSAVSVLDLFTLAARHVDRMAFERRPTDRWY